MSVDLKDYTTTPTLSFDAVPDAQELPVAAGDMAGTDVAPDAAFTEENLTPEELKMVDDFSKKIDIHNSQAILQYGVGTQKKMADCVKERPHEGSRRGGRHAVIARDGAEEL